MSSSFINFFKSKLYLKRKYYNLALKTVIYYFATLTVSYHELMSLFGFFTFLTIANQLISGTMLAFSLVTESMMIPLVRDEEDVEDIYTDDFFWLHERGVDLLFIFVFFHLFRKLYLASYDYEQEFAWKSGVFSFLILQLVVFLGLVLCCTHLSEITLTIAVNALHTVFFFKGKVYWLFFTDRFLNTDTIIRLAYAHYVMGFFLAFLGLIHGVDMHYDWKNEGAFDGLKVDLFWYDEALLNEFSKTIDILLMVWLCCLYCYTNPEALSYEIFMWGDVGMSVDVRFYGVAPHWYFRPYMSWLIVCPAHRPGLFGLVYFFIILFYQPNIHGMTSYKNYQLKTKFFSNLFRHNKNNTMFVQPYFISEVNLMYQFTYGLFIICVFYTTSFLPYGRFYNRLEGNTGMLLSYLYVFFYLGFPFLKRNLNLSNYKSYYFYQLYQSNGLFNLNLNKNEINYNFSYYSKE